MINIGDTIRGMCVIDKLHNHKAMYLCYCVDCHALHTLRSDALNKSRKGKIKCDCGLHDKSRTHGLRHHKLYNIFSHMKQRCYDKNDKRYKNYGGRGINVCDEWLKDFKLFYDWSMSNGYQDNLTIDRIDVNGNYEPSNCRWVDWTEQARNRTNNKYYTINDVTKCLGEWCKIYNVNYNMVRSRLKYNWSIEKALTIPSRKDNQK